MRSIFLLVGQSNMVGRGNRNELSQNEQCVQGLEMFRCGRWQPHQEPLQDMNDPVYSRPADRHGGIGPASSFGRELIANGYENVGLLLCAKGGTGLSAWGRDGQLYTEMTNRVALAKQGGRLCGMIVYVGEGETRSVEAANSWRPAFEALVTNVRNDTNSTGLPVVFAQIATISPERRATRDHGHVAWDHLKELQASIAMDNVAMVKTEDLSLKADGLHLSAASQLRLGKRFGEAMVRLLANERPS